MPDADAGRTDELRASAAAAVSAVPGVVRIEPTLSNALRRLRTATVAKAAGAPPRAYSAADGIRLTRHGVVVDVRVDIVVTTERPAHRTAQAVRDTLRDAILASDLAPGEISVIVLRVQP